MPKSEETIPNKPYSKDEGYSILPPKNNSFINNINATLSKKSIAKNGNYPIDSSQSQKYNTIQNIINGNVLPSVSVSKRKPVAPEEKEKALLPNPTSEAPIPSAPPATGKEEKEALPTPVDLTPEAPIPSAPPPPPTYDEVMQEELNNLPPIPSDELDHIGAKTPVAPTQSNGRTRGGSKGPKPEAA